MSETQPNPVTNLKLARRKQTGLGLLLLGVTVLAYLPALKGGYIIDDAGHVTAPALRSFGTAISEVSADPPNWRMSM